MQRSFNMYMTDIAFLFVYYGVHTNVDDKLFTAFPCKQEAKVLPIINSRNS